MNLRRNFTILNKDRVLVVEDVITTAGSVKEVIEVIRSSGAEVVGIGCLADRTSAQPELKLPIRSLVKLNFKTYSPNECPMCKKGSIAIKPGSRNASDMAG